MATFPFPDLRPAEVQWQLITNSQSFVSPFTGIEQTAESPGSKWLASLRFENLKRSEIAELEAFIMRLRGKANRALLWNHARENPRGSGSGTPLVRGAGQTGGSIISDGWQVNQSGVLLVGDYVSIGGELKIITADVNSDAGGLATLQIESPQRYAPVDNSLIVINNAPAKMMLVDDKQGRITSRRALNNLSLSFIEDIR